MKQTSYNKLLHSLFMALCLTVCLYLPSRAEQTPPVPENGAQGLQKNAEKAVELAIHGINLFQGKDGLELWRLKANWAQLSQNGDEIVVEKPHVLYSLGKGGLPPAPPESKVEAADAPAASETEKQPKVDRALEEESKRPSSLPEGENVLSVTADHGKISEQQRHLVLWDNVIIHRPGDTIRASRAEYTANDRTLIFPQGAELQLGQGLGKVGELRWNLENNVLTAQGGIEVTIKPKSATRNKPEQGSLSGEDSL